MKNQEGTENQEKSIVLVQLEKDEIVGSKAEMIEAAFLPMIEMIKGVESEFAEIAAKEISEDVCKEARALRLKLVKIRTATGTAHKEQKAEYLRAGRAIDGVKNVLEFAIVDKEQALEAIEKHFENIEKEKLLVIKAQREAEMKKFDFDFGNLDLSQIVEPLYNTMLAGAEKQFNDKIATEKAAAEAKIEADRKAEEEKQARIEELKKLQAEKEERDRIELEKRIIRDKRSREMQPFIIFIRDYNAMIEMSEENYLAELEEVKKYAKIKEEELRFATEQKALAEQKASEERIKQEEILRKEREEKAKIQAELEAKKQAEAIAEQEKQEAIERELSLGDKGKMLALVNDLDALKSKYSFKSKKHQKIQTSINELISKTVAFAKEKI